jgi:hypothetical protein
MNARKIIILASIGLALFILVPTQSANAQPDCYYCNPLLFPFAVAAAVVGTAAAIATAPFCPYCGPYYYGYPYPPPAPVYYRPAPYPYGPRVWVRGHYDRYGQWVPGHWRYRY